MEIWDAYTKDGILTGGKLTRGEPIEKGLYHLVSEVLVIHRDGSVLCMKRAETKKEYPGYYETSAGGSALAGEDALTCAKRELFEETGIIADELEIVSVTTDTNTIYNSFVCITDRDKQSIRLLDGETVAYKWMNREEFCDFINSDKAIDRQRKRLYPYLVSEGYVKE